MDLRMSSFFRATAKTIFLFWCLSIVAKVVAQTSSYDLYIDSAGDALKAGDPNKAYSSCNAAREMKPSRYEAYIICAAALRKLQKTEDAVGMLQVALVYAPEDKKNGIRDAITQMRALFPAPASVVPARPSPPVTVASTLTPGANSKASTSRPATFACLDDHTSCLN